MSASHGKYGDLAESDRLAAQALDYVSEGRLKEASQSINQALQQKIDKSYYHLLNGLIYHLMARQGSQANYEIAAQGYAMAIKFDPANWMAHFFLGRLKLDEGKFDQALNEFAEAIILHPDDPQLLSSLLYAAYRSGSPDVAAAALVAIEAKGKGKVDNQVLLQNGAMVMAALGQEGMARDYLERLRGSGAQSRLVAHVEGRVTDWLRTYRMQGESSGQLQKAQGFGAPGGFGSSGGGFGAPSSSGFGAPSGSGFGSSQSGFGAFPGGGTAPAATGTADASASKMVVVDVVMIGTEENISTSRGLNLLNGLQIQFGNPGGSAWSHGYNKMDLNGTSSTTTDSITRSIAVPGITYSLNIFNAANQRNEVLARPTLVALAGRPSEFFSGVELNAVSNPGGQGSNPISIQKEIGVQLSVTPQPLPDGRVNLTVMAQRTFIKTPSADATFQQKLETTKNKVSANVVMRYGETLIIGGLSEKESGMTRDGMPFFQDVPLLQYVFARRTNSDYQKSVMILITPRPPQYVYQPEKAREEYEKSLSEDERPIASLRARYADWFKPYPNWASMFHQLQENSLYREFRTGDVDLENWADMRSISDRLRSIKDFLYY